MSDAAPRPTPSASRGLSLGEPGRLMSAVVLACCLVAAIAVGIVLSVAHVRANDEPAGVDVDATMSAELQSRQDVQVAVSSFVANLNSYSVSDISGYRDRLTPLLTPGFARSFDLAVDNIVNQVKATHMTSEGEVLTTAVSTIDSDTATALVVSDAHVSSALGERVRHFRWKVTLVKRDRTWLVDNFEPVV